MAPPTDLPVDAAATADFASDLRPGETLVWAARPDAARYCRVRPRLVGLGVFWVAVAGAGFYGFGATFLAEDFAGIGVGVRLALLAMAAAPFAGVAVFCLGGHVAVLRWAHRRTAFGLTDRRVLVRRPQFHWIGAARTRSLELAGATLRSSGSADEPRDAVEVHDRRGVADPLVLECLPAGALDALRHRTAPPR